ncbi:MAG: hypothetical protein ACPGVZ_04235 [Myxococcota bacterium]
MARIHFPEIAQLGGHLEGLVGAPVSITPRPSPNGFDARVHTARYRLKDDGLAALLQVDLDLAARLGSALAMMPAEEALAATERGALDEDLTDAWSEVANVLAALLCADDSPHVRWTELATSESELTVDDKDLLAAPCDRIDVEIEVEAYGAGLMTLLTARLD